LLAVLVTCSSIVLFNAIADADMALNKNITYNNYTNKVQIKTKQTEKNNSN